LGPKRDSGILLAGFIIAMVMGMGIGHNLADPERFKVSKERERELEEREKENRKRWEELQEYIDRHRDRQRRSAMFTRHHP
jgi:biotin-(acetyl-CoA carboxylase) ligase